MKKIILERGQGKTYQLIKESALTGDYIVCTNQREASHIQGEAKKMKVKIPFPITYSEFFTGSYYPKGIKGFLIDNVELLLEYLSPVPVNAITITAKEEDSSVMKALENLVKEVKGCELDDDQRHAVMDAEEVIKKHK